MKLILTLAGVLLLVALSSAAACGDPDEGAPTEADPCVTEADVVVLSDASSSILAENYPKQFEWLKALARRFVIGPVRFGSAIFSYDTEKLFDLKDNLDYSSLDAAWTGVTYMNSSTYLGKAISLIDYFGMWDEANGGRATASKFLVIVTDGNPNRIQRAYDAADAIKAKGIEILTVAVGADISLDIMESIASSPDNVFSVDSYNDLDLIAAALASRTCEGNTGEEPTCLCGYTENADGQCEDLDECQVPVCGQNCQNTEGSYICSCNSGYVVDSEDTDACVEPLPCTFQADIIIGLDASSSIGYDNYQKMLQSAQAFVEEVGITDVYFAAMVFSYQTTILFEMNDYTSLQDALDKIGSANYDNSSTYTHRLFNWISGLDMFAEGREGVPNSVLLFTDGNPNQVSNAITAAQALKDDGVIIVGVAIGDDIDMDILGQMVSDPPEDYIIPADDYDRVHYVNQRLAQQLCGAGM